MIEGKKAQPIHRLIMAHPIVIMDQVHVVKEINQMPTLPQIQLAEQSLTQELNEFLSRLDELGLEPEAEQIMIEDFFSKFLANEQELKDKVNASCWYLTSLAKDAQYYREQSARFKHQAQVTENRYDAFKSYIQHIVESKGGKFPTKDFPKLATRKVADSVEIDNSYDGEIPDQYLKAQDLEDMVSKTAIAKDLKAGIVLPFAKLVNKGKALVGLK